MSARTTEILREVLSMPAEERAELVDSILASLEPSDPRILHGRREPRNWTDRLREV